MSLIGTRRTWACVICAVCVGGACREREPVPRHNYDLGSGDQHLLPTPRLEIGEALPGGRRVEIPDRATADEFVARANRDTTGDASVQDAGDGAEDTGGGVISSFLNRLRGGAGARKAPQPDED